MYVLELDIAKDLMDDVKKKVKALNGNSVKVGMFSESGKHYSGYTYVQLFKYLSEGDPKRNMPPRSPLQVVTALVPLVKSSLRKDLQNYLESIKNSSVDVESILEALGAFYREEVRDIFGDPSKLASKAEFTKSISNSPDTPLIEDGTLAKRVAYKVNNKPAKEIGR